MQVDDAHSDHSSSISSPPVSPQSFSDTINVARPPIPNSDLLGGGVVGPSSANSAQPSAVRANTTSAPAAPEKVKRQRKKKEVGPDGKPLDDGKPKEKKPRKPREPKDKTAANGSAAPRKKVKAETKPAPDAPPAQRQPTITDMAGFQSPGPSMNNTMPPHLSHANSEGPVRTNLQPQTTTPTSHTVRQRYDPVRGTNIDSTVPRTAYPPSGPSSAQASPHMIRATASPSIAIGSLIDPPTLPKAAAPSTLQSSQSSMQQPIVPSQPRSASPPRRPTSAFVAPPTQSTSITPVGEFTLDGAMETDTNEPTTKLKPQQPGTMEKMASKAPSSSSGPTPKATRPTPPPAPKGTGSGLLSSSDLFGGPSNNEPAERRGVNIDIQIKLNPNGGNTINLAQEIFKKYGREAINPRAAAHRERLLQVAAAQNKIEGGSADDMGVDLMSDLEDSNVEMGGMYDSNPTPADGEKPRKRRKKVEEYDKEDDFIDDTELAWQEQAAVAKDGFFVYSGPLVPAVEPTRGEASTTGRGRGRGRGRARAGSAAAGTTHASLAEKKDPAAPAATGRGRGRGRGTGVPRKPRITKAEREKMEIEKKQREEGGGMPLVSGTPQGAHAVYPVQGPGTTA